VPFSVCQLEAALIQQTACAAIQHHLAISQQQHAGLRLCQHGYGALSLCGGGGGLCVGCGGCGLHRHTAVSAKALRELLQKVEEADLT